MKKKEGERGYSSPVKLDSYPHEQWRKKKIQKNSSNFMLFYRKKKL